VIWEGRQLPAKPGQSLAAALWGAGIQNLAEPGAAPRGLYCGAGHCYSCRVVVDGVHAVRACMVAARDGMRADREPGTREPPALTAPSDAPDPAPRVAVIGAGSAGLAAATALARLGIPVAVIDEAPAPGGRLIGTGAGDRLVAAAREAGAQLLCGAAVWGVSAGWRLNVAPVDPARPGIPVEITAERLIVATGAVQLPLALPGWTLPGVLAPWAALHLLDQGALTPATRAVVVGTDPVTLAAARRLQAGGITVAAVVAPQPSTWVPAAPVAAADDLPLLADRRAVAFRGDERVRVVALSGPDGEIAADLAVAGGGLAPLTELVRLAGAPVVHVPELGGDVALHGPGLQTPVDGLYVAGAVAGVASEAVAEAQGRLAAVSCAASLGFPAADAPARDLAEALRRDPVAAAGHAAIAAAWTRRASA
jgi:NADPH-dependent 2,4-dienoyl-CoA reductase/sulfur reductase-like enzyme